MSKKRFVILALTVMTLSLLTAALLCFGMASFASETPTASIKYHNLSYKSNVSIKYAVEVTGLPEGTGVADVIGVKVRKGDTDYEAEYEGQTLIEGKEYSVFGFSELSAAEMTVDVYATPYVKISDTEVVTGNTHKNSILDYSYKILGKIKGGVPVNDDIKHMISRMLVYGAKVQTYTKSNMDRPADADYYQISVVNGALLDGFDKGLYREGDVVTMTATSSPGCIFSYWKNADGVKIGDLPTIIIEVGRENTTYTAVFERTDSSVKYELDGGILPDGYWSKYSPGATFTLPVPTKDGYVFSGWFTSADLTADSFISEIPANATGPYNIYAKWNKVIMSYDGAEIKQKAEFVTNDDSNNSFTAEDNVLVWNQGASKVSQLSIGSGIYPYLDGEKKFTLSITLASVSGKKVVPAELRVRRNNDSGESGIRAIYPIKLNTAGEVLFGAKSEFVICTLTEEFQTIDIVLDFEKKAMIYYDDEGAPKYIYYFDLPAEDANMSYDEWLTKLNRGLQLYSAMVTEGAALKIKNISLFAGNSVEKEPVSDSTLDFAEFILPKYQTLVETQRTDLSTIKGTWDRNAAVSATNPELYLFVDYTEDMGGLITDSYYQSLWDSATKTTTSAPTANNVWSSPGAYPTADQHPRLLVTKDTLPRIKAMLEDGNSNNPKFMGLVNETLANNGVLPTASQQSNGYHNHNAYNLSVIQAKALAYLLYGDDYYGYQAILYMKNYLMSLDIVSLADQCRYYGYAMFTAALVYDWCYDLLTETDKIQIIAGVENCLCRDDVDIKSSQSKMEVLFPPYYQGAVAGHGCEYQILRDYLSFAVAIYDEVPSWYEYIGGRVYNDFVPAREYLYQSGVVWQGTSYAFTRHFPTLISAWILETATGESPYGDYLQDAIWGLLNYEVASGKMFTDADGTGDLEEMSAYDDLAYLVAYLYGDADMMVMADYLRGGGAFGKEYSGLSTTVYVALRGLRDVEAGDDRYEGMELIKYYGSYLGQYVVREAWGDESSAAVFMKIKERTTSGHEHLDAGTFEIYYKGMLTSDGGCYDNDTHVHTMYYHDATISHNGLIIYNPSYANVSSYEGGYYSGGQRRPESTSGNYSLDKWISSTDMNTGTVTGRQHGYSDAAEIKPLYAYIAGDITKAYESDTVNYVGRRMLTVYTDNDDFPMVFFVYDDVESDSASYEKRFLLQITSKDAPTISGNTVITENGDGRLVLTSLSDSVSINGVGGRAYSADGSYDCASSRNYLVNGEQLVTLNAADDGHWGRVEIVSTANAKKATFMNVLYVTDKGNENTAEVTKIAGSGVTGGVFGDVAALFATSRDRAATSLSATVTGDGNVNYYVSGVAEGVWSITVDGVSYGTATATAEGGLLTFAAPAGELVVAPAN